MIKLHKERANPDLKSTAQTVVYAKACRLSNAAAGMALTPWQVAITETALHYVRLAARVKHLGKGFDFFVLWGSRHGGLPDSRSGKYHM